jgi:outer membrane receptor protein involved in Fe transport
VIDRQTNEALQFVNVKVTPAGSEQLVKGGITDATGSFNFTGLKNGSYVLTVSFVGYRNVTRNFTVSQQKLHHNYPVIYLSEDAQTLKEVQVTGQRSQMKLEVDRKTFSVDNVLAAAGASATELLEQIPSIEVTTDGEISLRGNTSVEVWINGKASGLTSDNRYEILQQIPAESIERIEVIDNPSAKFSAEGSAGIINVILKRDRKAGYYGSLRAGVDTKGGWNTGANMNYSSGILEAYGNVGYRARRGGGGSESEQEYLQTNQYQRYKSESENRGGGLFARAGLTWHVTEKDDISLSGMTMHGSNENDNTTPYHYGTIGAPQDTYVMTRRTSGDGKHHMYHAEVGYDHNWSDTHKLQFMASFNQWKGDNDNIYQDRTDYTDGTAGTATYQYRPLFMNNRSWETRLEYENQITDNWKLEAGYNGRFSHENTPQESWVADNWEGTSLIEDKPYYNRFIYDNDIHALYLSVNTKLWQRLGVMAGLRGEYWKVNTESYDWYQEHGADSYADGSAVTQTVPFKKDYFQLFPSLFLNYELTKTSQLQLNYTRRLHRPWGGQLNNFKNTRDATMVEFGNPELTPEFSNSFSLNYLKTWPEHTLSVSTYYRPTTDVIQRIRYQGDDGLMYMTSENVAKNQRAGVELIVKDKLFRILDLTTTLNGYYYKLDGFTYTIMGQTITGQSDENFSWDARLLASLILPYDISLQTTGNYRSRGVITQGYRKANGSVDLGLRKTFLNKTLALAVNWRDVFNTRHFENYTSSDTFTRHQKNWRDPRVNFMLTWNFGNMKRDKKKGPDGQEIEEDNSNLGGYGGGEGFE